MGNDQKVSINSNGVGFCGLLFIVLLLLKVGVVETAVVGWSWVWIFSPLWAPVALPIGILFFVGVSVLAFMLCSKSLSLINSTIKKYKNNKK